MQVIDSSRYFALRIDDGKGKHAFVGLGFRDRNLAYDFNATMQDHWKGVTRAKEAEELRLEMAARALSEPVRDLSLKEGETLSIKVNVPGASNKPRAPRPKPAEGAAGGAFSLPPPPGPGLIAPPPKPGAIPAPPSARTVPSASANPATAAGTAAAAAAAAGGEGGGVGGGGSHGKDGAAATAVKAADDDDGFGDFSTAPSAGNADDDDDFGDFTSS